MATHNLIVLIEDYILREADICKMVEFDLKK